jgi:hypothetical protein
VVQKLAEKKLRSELEFGMAGKFVKELMTTGRPPFSFSLSRQSELRDRSSRIPKRDGVGVIGRKT